MQHTRGKSKGMCSSVFILLRGKTLRWGENIDDMIVVVVVVGGLQILFMLWCLLYLVFDYVLF